MLRLTLMIGWKVAATLAGLDTLVMVIEIVIEVARFIRDHRRSACGILPVAGCLGADGDVVLREGG